MVDQTSSDDALGQLCKAILGYKKDSPVLVGIDGVDASGKTTMADSIAKGLCDSGRQIIRASIDGFHNSKATRYRRGRSSPIGYYQDSFNYPLLIEALLKPLSSGNLKYREAAFDYRTDKKVDISIKKAADDAILVMDGIFLFRTELIGYWDVKIFLDVGFEVILQRALKRAKDQGSLESEKDIMNAYNQRYIPGQKLYLQEANPREKADVLINNNDYENPVIVRSVLQILVRPSFFPLG